MDPAHARTLRAPGWLAAIAVAAWWVVVAAAPTDPLLHFRRLTPRDGLPPAVVYCIFEDSRGFLWFGTADGVARFDGHEFRTFRPDPADPSSLANPAVMAIQEDGRGNLWMATEGGLDLWHRETERFSHFRHDPQRASSLSDDVIQGLSLEPDGTLWVGSARGGLDHFDPRTEKSEHFPLPAAGGTGRPRLRCLFRGRSGDFWVGTEESGLFRFDPRARRFESYLHDPANPRSLSHNRVSAIAEDVAGGVWVGTDAGLCQLAADRRSFQRHSLTGDTADPRLGRPVSTLLVSRDGRLWVGTDGAGFCAYDPVTRRIIRHLHFPYSGNTIESNTVRAAFEDSRGDLWIGHFPRGVSHADRLAAAFQVFSRVPGEANTLSDNHVLSFLEDPSGDLWVGTDNGGLNHWSQSTGRWTSDRYSPDVADGLSAKAAVCLLRDSRGVLWVGTWGGGLDRMEPGGRRFRHYVPDPGREGALGNGHVWQLAEDGEHRLWVATIGGGVDRYDAASDSFVHYRHDPADPRSLNDDIASALLVARDGAFWVGTPKGLARWNPAAGAWDRFDGLPGGSLNGHWVFDLAEDRDGTIWATTEGGGLNRLDPRTGRCVSVRAADGLPSDTLRGILADDNGTLWIGTNRGLAQFDPATRRVRVFDESHGLPDSLFTPHGRLRLRGGDFLFGTTQGFVRFNPAQLSGDGAPPRVVLTDFEVFNARVRPAAGSPLERSITETRQLTIPAGLHVIGFQFSALTFRSTERLQYRFKLEGFDTEWRTPGPDRRATFTNLAPGRYRLRVKAANGNGPWSDGDAGLDLVIVPPWWATWWFRTGALLAFLGMASGAGWALSAHRAREAHRQLELASERTRAWEASRARAALQESEQRFREVTETIAEVFWLADSARQQIIYLSPAFGTLWGRTPGSFLESAGPWPPDVHADDVTRVRAASPFRSDGHYDVEYRIVRPDGTVRWIHDRAFAIRDESGGVRRIAGIAQDVTERTRAQQEVLQLNRELNRRVQERTAELESANQELEAFAYSVSHDLRAPLRHVDGFVERLQARAGGTLDDQSRHYLDVISGSAKRLATLIDDLLSFSRMARREMFHVPVDLTALVHEVVDECAADWRDRSVVWRIAVLPVVVGDPPMLRQVIANLISNALKFTGPRACPEIEVGAERGASGETVVFVRDNGVGFDMNYAGKLFGVFERLHSAEAFEGTGIGLANVRRIVTRHGGRTWAKGQVDCGATFYFSLPPAPAGDGGPDGSRAN